LHDQGKWRSILARLKEHHKNLATMDRSSSQCTKCAVCEERMEAMKRENDGLLHRVETSSIEKEGLLETPRQVEHKVARLEWERDAALREKDAIREERNRLQDQNCEFKAELATMRERCDNAKKELEQCRQEAIRCRGEKDDQISNLQDLISKLLPSRGAGASNGQPADPSIFHAGVGLAQFGCSASAPSESRVSESASWIKVASAASTDEKASIVSVCTSPSGEVLAQKLEKGSEVLAADGKTFIRVAEKPRQHPSQRIVDLSAGSAHLRVTRDHRIPMKETPDGSRLEAKAIELKPGNYVFVNEKVTKLDSIRELSQEVGVVKLVFSPDLPVGVFAKPIDSHGSKKRLHRGGKKKVQCPSLPAAGIESEDLDEVAEEISGFAQGGPSAAAASDSEA